MAKQYGLILPGQQKKPIPVQRDTARPSIFDESSASDDSEDGPPQMLSKKAPLGPSVMERRRARNIQEKALAEDPTIFQYDELYEDMENKREEEKQVKKLEPKKPKYITKLLETAERRKLENELRVERQVQKEREAEGEEFKDKEAFVTSSYRKKLEEMRKLEEQNKRDDYLEAIGDVTKQQDLDGFYRHLYEQKMGTAKEVKKPELNMGGTSENSEETISYKPIKSGKPVQQRPYRKRHSLDEEVDTQKKEESTLNDLNEKKQHLTNNIDADSDFSIDDSSSSESSGSEDEKDDKSKTAPKKSKASAAAGKDETVKTDRLKPEEQLEADSKGIQSSHNMSKDEQTRPTPVVEAAPEFKPAIPKRDKIQIWKKRTVGEAFEAAVQRYYERKAARSQA